MDTKDQYVTHSEYVEDKSVGEDVPQQQAALKSDYDKLGLGKTALLFRKACMVCVLICVAAAADGYQISLNGNIIANTGFIQHIGKKTAKGTYILPANEVAIWGALQSLGQLIGMLLFNPVSDRVGRKMTLYLLWLVLFASLMIESFVRHWQDWAGAKLLAGMGVGCIQSTLPIYITEWAPVNIRGAMLLAYSVLNNVGGFLAPLLLNFLQKSRPTDYKTSILTQWAFLGIMLPIFVWLPETASYFAACEQDDKGRATLRRINGHVEGYDVEAEYAIVKNTILEERSITASMGQEGGSFKDIMTSYIECLKGTNLRRTIGSTLPITAQQLTGLAFLNTYASLFFKQSGFTNAFEITTIITAIKIVMILTLVFTTDRFGRRNIVIGVTAICTLMMLLVGILGLLEKSPANRIGLIVVACIWSMGSAGQGALGWTFVGEVASQKLRARTAGLAAATSVLFGLTFNTTVPIMLDVTRANWGYKTAWLFFGAGVITTVLTFLYVPETAQRNSAEMDEMYEKGVPAWRMRKFVTDVQKKRERGSGV